MGIVVIGAIFVDIKGYPEDAYIPAGRNVGRVEQIHGGVGRNVAEDVANCELRPTFVSLVDRSGTGEDVLRKLKSHKVNVDYIRKTSNGIGTWLAVFNNEGDVVASISKRPDLSPIADILDEQGDEIFSQADSIIIEIDLEKEIIKRVFRLANKYHKKVFAVVFQYEHCAGTPGFSDESGLLCMQSAGSGHPVFSGLFCRNTGLLDGNYRRKSKSRLY